jgi:hypothetical protein
MLAGLIARIGSKFIKYRKIEYQLGKRSPCAQFCLKAVIG